MVHKETYVRSPTLSLMLESAGHGTELSLRLGSGGIFHPLVMDIEGQAG